MGSEPFIIFLPRFPHPLSPSPLFLLVLACFQGAPWLGGSWMLGSDAMLQISRGGRKGISLRERDFFLFCLEMLSQQSAGKELFLTGQIIKRWGVLVVWKSDLWLAPKRGTEPEQNPNKVAFLLYKQCTRKRMDELGKQLKCSQGELFCAI